ncbi:hypothetical protein ACFLX2_00950 [Candidatus Dependentiae bacterium]
MKKHVGIVLRKYSNRDDRFSVLDRSEGKIICMSYEVNLMQGSLISYFISRAGFFCTITGVQTLAAPFAVARQDLLFLHHVLELCYYFLPAHDVAEKTFDLLTLLYTPIDSLKKVLQKKFFLFKLLVSFGAYTQMAPLSIDSFNRLSSESIDSLSNSLLHLEIERNMDEWLCSCVGAHPCFGNFKTFHFLTKIRLP